jgi:eukaryotic translation initiation factor 2C
LFDPFHSVHVHFQVSISPEPKARLISRVLLSKLVEAHDTASFASRPPAYDGSKSLYTAGELPFESMDFVVKLGKESREMYGITHLCCFLRTFWDL